MAIGDVIGGRTVASVHVYDPINRCGEIALMAAFTDGSQSALKARPSCADVVDGRIEPIRSGNDVTNNSAILAAAGTPRLGLTCDGISRVLIRVPVSGPGTVQFDIVGAGTTAEWGAIAAPGSAVSATTFSTATTLVSGQHYAFAVYRSAREFVRAGSGDAALPQRLVSIRSTFMPAIGPGPVVDDVVLRLRRPPVVLCHGLWSSAETWKSFNPLISD